MPHVWQNGLLVNAPLSLYIHRSNYVAAGVHYAQVFIIGISASVHPPFALCVAEIKAVYSAQHKHTGINIVMSTAGF